VELRDYLRIMRRRWLMILSSVVGVAAVVTFNMTPQYAAAAGSRVTAMGTAISPRAWRSGSR
jgi:uncharacterized protein involved in exopolysaccharide biosynthesis